MWPRCTGSPRGMSVGSFRRTGRAVLPSTTLTSRGGTGVGVTLSSAQAAACRRHGLDVHLHDARQVTRDSFGPFDVVASLGAFEHFCAPEEQRAGRQEQVAFGPNMIPLDRIDIDGPRDSDVWYLALMGRQF